MSTSFRTPKTERRIRADDRLRPVLDGQDSVTMFELTQCVNRHLA